jgi:hypothetical protein
MGGGKKGMRHLVDLLANSPNITELVLCEHLNVDGATPLTQLLEDADNCYLRVLHLDNWTHDVTSAMVGARICEALAGNRTVTKLVMGRHWLPPPANPMYSPGRCISQLLGVNSTITDLSLVRENVGDVCMTMIGPVLATSNRSIHSLDLSENQLHEVGGSEIAHVLTHNTTLTSLDLSSCDIGQGGLGCIATALRYHNKTLIHLKLNNNHMTKEAGTVLRRALDDNTTLHTMDGVHYAPPLLLRNSEIRTFRAFACRKTVIALLSLKRHRRPPHMPLMTGDVLRYIGKLIMAQALDPRWGRPPVKQRKKRAKKGAAAAHNGDGGEEFDMLVDRE